MNDRDDAWDRLLFEDWEDYLKNANRATADFEAATDEMRRGELPLEHREPFDRSDARHRDG